MTVLSLGFSPCPNDTFIFSALACGRLPLPGLHLDIRIEDVETLNRLAAARQLHVTKSSLHAFGRLRRDYLLLRSGAALGRGYGPLLVARAPLEARRLRAARVAIPGRLTTAALLLRLYGVQPDRLREMPFHRIVDAVCAGEVDAGVVIHEARFTCAARGLVTVLDLGRWWETETGLPLPLGGIIARRTLAADTLRLIEQAVRRSLELARARPAAAYAFIRRHAREQDDAVLARHIDLYVNEFSYDLGEEGAAAVRELLRRAEAAGVLPPCPAGLFAEDG
jgi:1,4-dihydroxy-6-naphthoate synthase